MTTTYYGLDIPLPERVYHYTSADAFASIMRHQSGVELCATDYRELNDRTEFLRGCKEAVAWLAKERGLDGHAQEDVMAILEDPEGAGVIPYVVSFTSEGDSTVHWMVYADASGGVSIGFDPEKLRRLAEFIDGRAQCSGDELLRGGALLAPCIYVDGKDGAGLVRFQAMLDYVFSDQESFNRLKTANCQKYAQYCARHVMLVVSLLKSAAFKFEKEWRLVVVPASGKLNDRLRVIGGKPRISLKPFVQHDAVASVTISPHGNVARIRHCVEAIRFELASYMAGLGDFKINDSRSPYRGR